MAVRVSAGSGARGRGGAFGVVDAGIDRTGGVLGPQGQFRRRLDVELPRVVQTEIGRIDRHERRVGEAGVLVGRRETRDAHRLGDDGFDSGRREVAGARVALAAVPVNRDAETPVLLPLDRFELAHADGHAEPLVIARGGFRLIRAPANGDFHGSIRAVLKFASQGVNVHRCTVPKVRSQIQRSRIAQWNPSSA